MPTLRELREARGWSQAELAAKVGVSQATVARWETPNAWRHLPRRPVVIALGHVFGVDPDAIRFGEGEPRPAGRPKKEPTP